MAARVAHDLGVARRGPQGAHLPPPPIKMLPIKKMMTTKPFVFSVSLSIFAFNGNSN